MEPIQPNTLRGAAQPNSLTGMGPAAAPGGRGPAGRSSMPTWRAAASAARPRTGRPAQSRDGGGGSQDPRLAAGPAAVRVSFAAPAATRRSPIDLAVAALSWIIALPAAIAVVAGLAMSITDEGASNLTAYGDALTAAGIWVLIGWFAVRALRAIAVSRRLGVIGTWGALAGGSVAVVFVIGALGNLLNQLPLLLQGP